MTRYEYGGKAKMTSAILRFIYIWTVISTITLTSVVWSAPLPPQNQQPAEYSQSPTQHSDSFLFQMNRLRRLANERKNNFKIPDDDGFNWGSVYLPVTGIGNMSWPWTWRVGVNVITRLWRSLHASEEDNDNFIE